VGEIELLIPRVRQGSHFPSFLEPRRRSEQAIVAVVPEAYVNGVSAIRIKLQLVPVEQDDGNTEDYICATFGECTDHSDTDVIGPRRHRQGQTKGNECSRLH
jgi:hypothetical protein